MNSESELLKRRDALYMKIRYWKLHEKKHGVNEKASARQKDAHDELVAVRQSLRDIGAAKREQAREAKLEAVQEIEEQERRQKQIEENKRISSQCRTTRNRPATWRASSVIFYDPTVKQEGYVPQFNVDLSR